MKKIIGAFAVLISFYTLDAHALFTDCQIDYTVNTGNFVIGIGGGSGTARCKDIIGNYFDVPIHVGVLGAGLKVGGCTAHGHIAAVGVGFAIDEILGAQVKVEVGAMVNHGASVGPGVNVNPLGTNVSVTGSISKYEGPCLGIADGEILSLSRDFGREMHRVTPVPEIQDPPRDVVNQNYTPGGSYFASGRYYFPNGVYVENGVYYTADGVAYYANGHYLTASTNNYAPTPVYAAPITR